MKLTIFSVLLLFMSSSFESMNETVSGYQVTQEMFARTEGIHTLTYTISKQERIEGEVIKQVSFTKMQKSPYRVYLRQSYPNDGMEVLYVEGANNNKAIVNPNGFPWLNLKLNPLDGLMRNKQHHTIFQSGFDHVISILEYLCAKYESQIDQMIIHNGMLDLDGRNCHSISFINPYFEHIEYTVKSEETIEDIANRYKLSAYMILEINPKIKDYEDVEPGQKITIPNDYSPKLDLVIDAQNLVPLRMEIYDDKGLYELYEYSQVVINPDISDLEFSEKFDGYGF